MTQRITSFVCLILTTSVLQAVEPVEILPSKVKYDNRLPTPESVLAVAVGERHLHHHELVGYVRTLAAASDRVSIEDYATSYGGKPLVLLTITSPRNHARLESLRRQHLDLADPEKSAGVSLDDLPAVIYMGYSVHGNEPSGGNAAALLAYYLAAASDKRHRRLLDEVVILLDPCLNPDGFERFAQWANDHRGAVPNPDAYHREHRERWPNGRTNYYWFDLNRDWLPLQHPESQGRVAAYHRWKPNVLLDVHEMDGKATFFFQPGVPERNHPLTPQRTYALTREIAQRNAVALDQIGSLYFTEERFDDFYMGKGSTYPDLHGAVGILFEQGSSRGHLHESPRGDFTFAFTIRNQFVTSLSSLRATATLRRQLLDHKRTFYQDALALARNGETRAYVVAAPHDPARLRAFLDVLHRHDIRVHQLAKDLEVDGRRFGQGEAYLIPCAQPEYRFIQTLFERRTEFQDSTFYDVSAWTLPLAFDLQYSGIAHLEANVVGEPASPSKTTSAELKVESDDLAYIIDWRSYAAGRLLYRLLDAEIRVEVAQEPFVLSDNGSRHNFGCGTLMVPLGIQAKKRATVVRLLREAATEGLEIVAAKSGLTPEGIDLGSSGFRMVPKPRVLLVVGEGVSSNEAGEVWHLLDQRIAMPVSMVDVHELSKVSFDEYTLITLVSGSYVQLGESAIQQLSRYLENGGTLVALGTSIRWVDKAKIVDVTLRTDTPVEKESENTTPQDTRPYRDAARDATRDEIRGSILKARVDATHPLCYGYEPKALLPVSRSNRLFLELAPSEYSSPLVYDDKPLMSGYVSQENLAQIAGSAGVAVYAKGKGRVILMADNPNFRAFWYGTNRLYVNSVFFGPLIRVP